MAVGQKAVLAVLLASLTASCAIRPDIEDTTGFRPADIVRKVRCEAREAIKDKLAVWLRTVTADGYAQQIYAPLLAGTMSIRAVEVTKFSPGVARYVNYFMETGLAYDFTLNMTEKNDADATVDLLDTISGGTLTAGLASGVRRTRNNTQTFIITDTFRTLSQEVEDGYCDPNKMPSGYFNEYPNYLYPIAGRVGVDRMVDDFVDLTLFGALTDSSKKVGGPPTMANSLEFTTYVYGDATPKVVIAPTLTGASIGFKNSREDKHKLIVGFALTAKLAPQAELPPSFVIARPGAPAEQLAVQAVDRFIGRNEFGRTSIVIDGQTLQ